MQPAGLLVMIASVGTVTALFGWCLWKVLMPAEVMPNRQSSASE